MKTATTMLAAALTALAVVVAGGVSQSARAAEYEMAIATLLPENMTNNEVYPALVHFKQLVESRTGGAVEVSIFGGAQLGSEVETGKQVQAGGKALQSNVMSSGAMSSFYRKYQIVTTPFLFPNWEVAWEYFDGPWHAEFMEGAIEESDMRYLGTFDDGGGFVAFTNNKRLIKTVDDVKGLNIRVEENPAHVATMKALGASATPLPWGEVLTALETGLADGQFNAPTVNTTYKLYEVTDYTTMTRHVYNSATWVVSEAWYQSLPEEHQQAIIQSAREAIEMSHGIAAGLATAGWRTSCEKFEECYVLPAAEREKMAALARPAWKDWIVNDFGVSAELVEGLWAEVDRIAKEVAQRDYERYGQ